MATLAIAFGPLPAHPQQTPAAATDAPAQALSAGLERLRQFRGAGSGQIAIIVSVGQQRLYVVSDTTVLHAFPVSTSKFGVGNQYGSKKTPAGMHRILEKIGSGAPAGMIFRERRATGRLAEILTDTTDTALDLVTTRILWLDGLERHRNKGGRIDSHDRYIYIHGTPEEGLIGSPQSNGCIRMKNADVIALFDLVASGTLVEIHAGERQDAEAPPNRRQMP